MALIASEGEYLADACEEGVAVSKAWAQAARDAVAASHGLSGSKKMKALTDVAKIHGVSVQTLKRAIYAVEFSDEFKKSKGIDLQSQPMASVEELRKWASHDAEGAADAAAQIVLGRMTVRALRNAEKLARNFAPARSRSGYLTRAQTLRSIEVALTAENSGYERFRELEKNIGIVNFAYVRRGRNSHGSKNRYIIACVLLNNSGGVNPKRRAIEYLFQCAGMASVYESVFLFVEGGPFAGAIEPLLNEHPVLRNLVQVRYVTST